MAEDVVPCKYNCDDGWCWEPDGYGCGQWTLCVCVNTHPEDEAEQAGKMAYSGYILEADDEPPTQG